MICVGDLCGRFARDSKDKSPAYGPAAYRPLGTVRSRAAPFASFCKYGA